MTVLMVIGTLVTAAATAGIFFFTKQMYSLQKELTSKQEDLQKKQEDQEQKFHDLLEALVIATIISGPSSTGGFDNAKAKFIEEYKGKEKIFKRN